MNLGKNFYRDSTTKIAQKLLGTYLVHEIGGQKLVGRIIETEAYLSKGDPACHAAKGMTKRNRAMFGPAGTAYIYFIYGMYHCFNVVTAREGVGEAVLIRALEPQEGISLMSCNRGRSDTKNLCSGPGKLVMAMGIHPEQDGDSLHDGRLYLTRAVEGLPRGARKKGEQVIATPRIGISQGKDLPLRFLLGQREEG